MGLRVWLDKWNLVPGDPWQEDIERAIDASACVVILVGTKGLAPWQNEEMRAALRKRVSEKSLRVLPVLLPGRGEVELPTFLSALTWVKFDESLEDPEARRRLLCGIKGIEPGPADTIETRKTLHSLAVKLSLYCLPILIGCFFFNFPRLRAEIGIFLKSPGFLPLVDHFGPPRGQLNIEQWETSGTVQLGEGSGGDEDGSLVLSGGASCKVKDQSFRYADFEGMFNFRFGNTSKIKWAYRLQPSGDGYFFELERLTGENGATLRLMTPKDSVKLDSVGPYDESVGDSLTVKFTVSGFEFCHELYVESRDPKRELSPRFVPYEDGLRRFPSGQTALIGIDLGEVRFDYVMLKPRLGPVLLFPNKARLVCSN